MVTEADKQMVTLEEGGHPLIYAFAFILNHGESRLGALRIARGNLPHVGDLERTLSEFGFYSVVRYCTLVGDDDVLRGIHRRLDALIVGFPSC
jgi:hypothetical protein